MDEEKVMMIVQMISAVGSARNKYMEAIASAKEKDFEGAEALLKEGGKYFSEGHKAHAEMLAGEANGVNSDVTLLLVHAEDQMMCAEAFKSIAEELIDMYKVIFK